MMAVNFPISREGVSEEKRDALIDTQMICQERGRLVKISLRDEQDITRDAYNSIKRRTNVAGLSCYAYPIEPSPTEHQMEKAGVKENVDSIIYTAMQDWIDAGLNYEDIEVIRSTVELEGCRYQVKAKNQTSQFSDTYLYITLGLVKL
jgi:hypothetical protein